MAAARRSSHNGFPSRIPQIACGSAMKRAPWLAMTVARPATAGTTIFGPPLNPANRCGSMKPVSRRTEAFKKCLLIHTGVPRGVVPTWVSSSSLRASCCTMRYCATSSGPSISRSSSGVLARWVPVPLMSTIRSRPTTVSTSSNSTGSTRSLGIGRVMSQKTTATVSVGESRSRRGGVPTGSRSAARSAAASSGRPGT